jgi:GH15 family glucan-1,4-alpha-glucosidase
VPLRIEDYAMIGDLETAALVGRDGSIDWLCLPRFDSGACFAALLGNENNGRWLIAPQGGVKRVSRRYRGDSLVLETTWETEDGVVRVTDAMPIRDQSADVVRLVEGVEGRVPMHTQLIIRTDYGHTIPWVRREEHTLRAIGGPDALTLQTPVAVHGKDFTTVGEWVTEPGEHVPFTLTWQPSHKTHRPSERDVPELLRSTCSFWEEWVSRGDFGERHRDAVVRSMITLKGLTYAPTGGILAAPTTSLPEQLGGVRNWDYRACWLRDATLTLLAFLEHGYLDEARAWREWLLRAVAGHPAEMQIMYGPAGERRLPELELEWLPGYERSAPVRIGNAASRQFQLDVFGEVMDMEHQARTSGVRTARHAWHLETAILDFLEGKWQEADDGIWEVRGGRRHFVHSKVMAWVAFDRAVKAVEVFGVDGDADRWRRACHEIREEVCRKGFDSARGSFVQSYGSNQLDAALLNIPIVGFLPATDARVRGTIEAIERELLMDGFVMRYPTEGEPVDGLPPGEGAFLPCTFWLADCYCLLGRHDEAHALFDRLLSLRNDVGLLAEEYDPRTARQLGNFPQAFSHVGLVNTAANLDRADGPAEKRARS